MSSISLPGNFDIVFLRKALIRSLVVFGKIAAVSFCDKSEILIRVATILKVGQGYTIALCLTPQSLFFK